jgi:hypothetical protein
MSQLPDAGAPPVYEKAPARSGLGGLIFGAAHLALAVVSLRLAADEEWAADKVSFASDGWRVALGVAGTWLAVSAVLGFVRMAADHTRTIAPPLHRRARLNGKVLLLIGAAFVAASVFDLGSWAVEFGSWAKTLYLGGGLYLLALGLSFQLDPNRTLREQRLRKRDGVPGVATVLRATETGASVEGAPQVRIDFEIEVNGRMREASDTITIEREKLPLLVPGSKVNVVVDKVDQSVFHVYWSSWRAPDPG